MRSKLFVPASRPELFAKALSGDADALSFDLEDAVQEARKGEARRTLEAFLRQASERPPGKILIVRVNGLTTPHFEADLAAVVSPAVDMINLPKPESVEEVRTAAAALARVEAEWGSGARSGSSPISNRHEACGWPRRSHGPTRASSGSSLAWAISSSPSASTGPTPARSTPCSSRFARGRGRHLGLRHGLRDGGGSRGIYARGEGRAGARLHREVLHSSHPGPARQRGVPSGVGAFLVDGRMIDVPFVKRAESVLAAARRLGLTPASRHA
jgi:citrate lyase subunit beta/citryl-CoA lyase